MSDSNEEDQLPPGVSAVLRHPSGVDVFIVGVAHVSQKACADVTEAVLAVMPGVVVIELDKARFDNLMEGGDTDPYGIKRRGIHGILPSLNIVLGGKVIEYGFSIAYIIVGALLGAPPGREFFAAVQAANQVGAEVVLGDRSQEVTMQRLSRAAFSRSNSESVTPEIQGSPAAVKHETIKDAKKAVEKSYNSFLLKAGCTDPDAVVASFKRILERGMRSEGGIDQADVLTVRECGQKVVESLRQKAITEGDGSLDGMEGEVLQKVGMGAGVVGLQKAMQQVVGTERDLVLARSLYLAGERSDRPVVGVVGAAHIKGIKQQWGFVGTPEAAEQVAGLMVAPRPDPAGAFASVAITGTCIGLLAYTKPRLAAKILAAGVLLSVPSMTFMAVNLNRWSTFAERMVDISQEINAWTPSGESTGFGSSKMLDMQPDDFSSMESS